MKGMSECEYFTHSGLSHEAIQKSRKHSTLGWKSPVAFEQRASKNEHLTGTELVQVQFSHVKTRYRGLAKNRAQLFNLLALANLFLVRPRLMA